jgi:hypothetical protein
VEDLKTGYPKTRSYRGFGISLEQSFHFIKLSRPRKLVIGLSSFNKSTIHSIHALTGMILFVVSLYLAYNGVVSNPPATAADYNLAIVVTVAVILILYGTHEYLHL